MNANILEIKVQVKNTSPMILSTGESDSSYVDNQTAFDELGFPYFSARRFKGLVVESAREVESMMKRSKFKLNLPSSNAVFGTPKHESTCHFSDLTIHNYDKNREYMLWLVQKSNKEVNREAVIDAISSVRQQTAITEKGVSKDNSLRTIRVLNPGYKFEGVVEIDLQNAPENAEALIVLALKNLRHAGLNRTRGFGDIECTVDKTLSDKIFNLIKREV